MTMPGGNGDGNRAFWWSVVVLVLIIVLALGGAAALGLDLLGLLQ